MTVRPLVSSDVSRSWPRPLRAEPAPPPSVPQGRSTIPHRWNVSGKLRVYFIDKMISIGSQIYAVSKEISPVINLTLCFDQAQIKINSRFFAFQMLSYDTLFNNWLKRHIFNKESDLKKLHISIHRGDIIHLINCTVLNGSILRWSRDKFAQLIWSELIL